MGFLERIQKSIRINRSLLCVGLDPDRERLPETIDPDSDGVRRFLMDIIDATAPYAVVYKPNMAFFGSMGIEGLHLLKEVIECASQHHAVILDAKFGDIGNTARHYAHMACEGFGADAVTVNPYLGRDSISPFLDAENCYSFILGITSNPGSKDLQKRELIEGKQLFQHLAETLESDFPGNNWGWVAGATQVGELAQLRRVSPGRWFLVPGVGEQGGALEQALGASQTPQGNYHALINASRSVLYASKGSDYAAKAAEAACQLVEQMRQCPSFDSATV